MDGETGLVTAGAVRGKGSELQGQYRAARPFPHVVIDDFLPESIIDLCIEEFGGPDSEGARSYSRDQELFKREVSPDVTTAAVRRLFYSFNSLPFIQVLENITGIKGLIPDPYFMGGGFHEIGQGGYLSVHTDFNHHMPMHLERRINVLIYLNRDWSETYGGQLELWDTAMKACEVSVVPVANRCVIFNTDGTSNHGNPRPIDHPAGVTRKSIALYYYTATWTAEKQMLGTHFKARPGSTDKREWRAPLVMAARDLLPPILLRALRRARGTKNA